MLRASAIPSDPAFPFLDAALDPERVQSAFADALRHGGRAIPGLRCVVERSRIKRGRKAIVGYRLSDGAGIDQRVMLALFPGGDPAMLPDMSDGSPTRPSPIGPDTLIIPELGGQAWFFPNDRKVRGIAQMVEERAGKLEVVHYVPEQGCTVRLREPDGRVLYGKCRADDRGAIAARFGAQTFADTGSLRLARIVSHDAKRRIVWQESVAGQPLDSAAVLAEPDLWAQRACRAIRDLHDLPPPVGLKQLTFASVLETVQRRIERVCSSLPDFSVRLKAMDRILALQCPAETASAPAHGDLHLGNLLWDGTSFGLIDLDTAALAPRAFDHATLTAALVHKAAERGAANQAIAQMIAALRQAAGGDAVDPAAFDWSLAASLLGERLYRCTTRLKSPSQAVREALVTFAERLVSHHA